MLPKGAAFSSGNIIYFLVSRIYAFIETEYFFLFLNKIKRILKLANGKIIAENGNNVSFLSLILLSVMYVHTRKIGE